MQLLITTPLQILQVDTATGKPTPIRSGASQYFGITFNESAVIFHADNYLKLFRRQGNYTRTHTHLVDPHQMEWVDDKILITNTGMNCLSVFDSDGQFVRDVYPNEIKADKQGEERTGNHFNSVHRKDGTVWIVAHNFDRPSAIWELTWPDLHVSSVIETNTSWAHNIWPGEFGLVVCNTKFGNLYNVTYGEVLWQSDEPNALTRGLAVSDDYIFVGRSLHAERGERKWTDGGVWVLDRKTLKIVDRWVFPGSGNVHDIRIIGETDYAHNNHVLTHEMVAMVKRNPITNLLFYYLSRRNRNFSRKSYISNLLKRLNVK